MSSEAISFDDRERSVLAGLADVLIPSGKDMPSANAAGVAGAGLDEVLRARPDLAEPLRRVLEAARDREPADAVAELEAKDPAGFAALTELVPGAYFLDPEVRRALAYEGQGSRPIDPEPDYLDLIRAVIDRGPIYRPTPGGS